MENVFAPSFGNRPDTIVGRDDVLERLQRGLSSRPGSRDRAVFVVGGRGMGKTALLLELESLAMEAGFVVARTMAGPGMAENLIEEIQINGRAVIGDDKRRIAGFSAGALGFSMGLTFSDEVRDNYGFQTKLSLLCDRLAEQGRGVLLLIDEVRSGSDEMRALASVYQHLVGDGKNVAICMAGLPDAISGVLSDEILTFLNRAVKIRLGPLSLVSVRAYYARAFREMGLSLSEGVLDEAVRHTAGFPYLLQLLGYYLVEEAGSEGVISDLVLSRAVEDSRADMIDNVFAPTLNALSPKDREFLRAMAADASGADGSRIADVQERMGVEPGYAQRYRARLLEAGVVSSPTRGVIRCTVPYLMEYLREEG